MRLPVGQSSDAGAAFIEGMEARSDQTVREATPYAQVGGSVAQSWLDGWDFQDQLITTLVVGRLARQRP